MLTTLLAGAERTELRDRLADACETGALDAVDEEEDLVAADPRVEVAMLPLADGLTVIRKR